MTTRSRNGRSQVAHSARVAAVVALLVAVLYVALTVIFDLVNAHHLLAGVDTYLKERLSIASQHASLGSRGSFPIVQETDHDVDAPPVLLWRVDSRDHAIALSNDAPKLPERSWSRAQQSFTMSIGGRSFRVRSIPLSGGWLVAGQSLADTHHVENTLGTAEVVAGPILVAAMYLGALTIGLMASGPVEQARRRQRDFTADASHELRTPLSVIEAEVDLALGSSHEPERYRETLQRVASENGRLRTIVEDLLWLARFDAEPPSPGEEPVDLATIAEGCADRFRGVARSRDIDLSVRREGSDSPWIRAPAEWVDRLAAVLVDNACRYAGKGGTVRILVRTHGNSVSLAVEDSGPGIPPDERPLLFDRFHRATRGGGGAGLGLAIADAVVRSTRGRWRVADAQGGGAHMEVGWHRFQPREPSHPSETRGIDGATARSRAFDVVDDVQGSPAPGAQSEMPA